MGAGDLNGDGIGDLLAQDKANVLWRDDGDGKGDLIARDTAGNLYRYTGTGKGTFGSRTKIGAGWGVHKSLF